MSVKHRLRARTATRLPHPVPGMGLTGLVWVVTAPWYAISKVWAAGEMSCSVKVGFRLAVMSQKLFKALFTEPNAASDLSWHFHIEHPANSQRHSNTPTQHYCHRGFQHRVRPTILRWRRAILLPRRLVHPGFPRRYRVILGMSELTMPLLTPNHFLRRCALY
jgi:hypothetical protein